MMNQSASCRHFLHDKELVTFLEQKSFDAVFMDPALFCGPILAESLSLPSIYFLRGLSCGADNQATECPNPPSCVPRMLTSYSDHMTFTERVQNMIFSYLEAIFCHFFWRNFENLASEFLQRETTCLELFSRASIWLLRHDFVLEYPRPLMPNTVFIGGITCVRKESLSKVRNLSFEVMISWLFYIVFSGCIIYPISN